VSALSSFGVPVNSLRQIFFQAFTVAIAAGKGSLTIRIVFVRRQGIIDRSALCIFTHAQSMLVAATQRISTIAVTKLNGTLQIRQTDFVIGIIYHDKGLPQLQQFI